MLSRAALRLAVKRSSVRYFQTSAIRREDLVQQLYLNELKKTKIAPLSAKDAEGSVLTWSVPKAPAPPTGELDISDVSAYESAAVEVQGVDANATAEPEEEDFFVIEDLPEGDDH